MNAAPQSQSYALDYTPANQTGLRSEVFVCCLQFITRIFNQMLPCLIVLAIPLNPKMNDDVCEAYSLCDKTCPNSRNCVAHECKHA